MITHNQAATMPPWAGEPTLKEDTGWQLITDYQLQATGWQAGLVDLSHRPKALVYGEPAEKTADLEPGRARWDGQSLLCRRKPGELVVFDLRGPLEPKWPDSNYTDMTDAWLLLGLLGPRALEVMQRMVAIDVEIPGLEGAFYALTRSHGLGVQMVGFKTNPPAYLLACDRSHGQNLVDGLIRSGKHLGITPLGLNAFQTWLEQNLKNG